MRSLLSLSVYVSWSVAERWWLVAGLLNTGTGILDPFGWIGDAFELRSEVVRFTSLFGGKLDGVLSAKIGVVESAYENAADPFECDTAAEPGRDVGEAPCSRDTERLLDSRRSHD